MANVTSFKFTVDNTEDLLKLTDEGIDRALMTIGLIAEGYAKKKCRVDTGLLRNSITYGLNGGTARSNGYKPSGKGKNSGKTNPIKHGGYSGTIDTGEGHAVAVGTNVEYAPFVEMGTSHSRAYPFIEPSIKDHANEWKRVFEEELAKIDI